MGLQTIKKSFMKKLTTLTLSALALLIFFSGIRRDDVKEEKYLTLAQQKQFDCVGQIFKDTVPRGSCVLVGDRFVLSAAHCFIDYDYRWDTIVSNGMTIPINKPINPRTSDITTFFFSFKGKRYQGKSLKIYPMYLDSITKHICDIALIELNEVVKTIVPAKISKSFDELHSNVVGVGFGESGFAGQPQTLALLNKKIAGENVIDSLSGFILNDKSTILLCDFDHPTRTDCNKMGSSEPRPLEYIAGGGDSGGGLFRQTKSGWELIGINSAGDMNIEQFMKSGYYGQIMRSTRVSVFANWISEKAK
jgi:Trypsin